MTFGSLFSGIGGFDLAAVRAGMTSVAEWIMRRIAERSAA